MPTWPDYRDNADAYDLEENSRPDEMAMLNRAGDLASHVLNSMPASHVLDLCCGTGLSMSHLVDHPNVERLLGVDISAPYLERATERYRQSSRPPHFVKNDAVEFATPASSWDLIMLASAYHHIEDDRKLTFLRRVRSLLKPTGYAVMAENILPDYPEGDLGAYQNSVRRFYSEVLVSARRNDPNLSPYVEGLIHRVSQYGEDGEYEYKVCWTILMRDLTTAGFKIKLNERVWPANQQSLGGSGGNFVLLLVP